MAKKTISHWDWNNFIEGHNPKKIAIRFNSESHSYKQIGTNVRALEEQYRRHFESGEIVALWLPNCPELLYACIAGFCTNIVPMPVNPEAKLPELIEILRRSRCHHLLVNLEQAKKLSVSKLKECELRCVWVIRKGKIEPFLQLMEDAESSAPRATGTLLPNEAALILHTSGSSGHAKGVVISRSSLEHIVRGRMESGEISQTSSAIIASSLSHSVGLYQALALLMAGGFFKLLESYDIPKLAEDINHYKPTHLILVVAAFDKLLNCKLITEQSFDSIQFAAVGADRVPEQLQQKFHSLVGRTLTVTYGMTELSWMLVNKSGQLSKSTSLGLAAPGVELRLVGKDGKNVEKGATGEIMARSPKAMLGYLNALDHHEKNNQSGWISSGDLAYQDDDGYYWYAGRINDLIALASGDLVAPLEVEAVIFEIKGIQNCVVLGMPSRLNSDNDLSELPWAIVVRENPEISEQLILEHLKERLSDYKLPRKIIFLDQMPEGASGKISRKGLRQWLMKSAGKQ